MLQNKKTYYLLILDHSGSMGSVADETLISLNKQIERIRELQLRYPEQEFIISFTMFNQVITNPLWMARAVELLPLGRRDYVPAGTTALYDAMGESITRLNQAIHHEIQTDQATAVVVVITDGHENSSRKYDHKMIRDLVGELDRHPNWTFSYLGATLDAMDVAGSLYFRKCNSMRFDIESMPVEMRRLEDKMDLYAECKSRNRIKKNFLENDEND